MPHPSVGGRPKSDARRRMRSRGFEMPYLRREARPHGEVDGWFRWRGCDPSSLCEDAFSDDHY